jgi:hypothetical protein
VLVFAEFSVSYMGLYRDYVAHHFGKKFIAQDFLFNAHSSLFKPLLDPVKVVARL